MKKLYISTFLLLFVLHLNAQVFEGTVTDEDGIPLVGASVYFNGSSVGRITDVEGKFSIEPSQILNPILVISYLGFQPLYVDDFSKSNQTYILKEEHQQLKDVLIKSSVFSRKELLKVFKREFLGTSKFGKSCTIVNENAIRISYNSSNKIINAYSTEALIVENKALGYTVYFNLEEFEASLSIESLKPEYLKESHFYGTSYYEELAIVSEKIKRNREKAYLGSITHFFTSIFEGKLKENGFVLAKKGFQVNESNLFKICTLDTLQKELEFGTSDFLKYAINFEKLDKEIPYKFVFTVLYNKKQTDATLTSPKLVIDYSGNFSPVTSLKLNGEMSKGKLSSLLPLNFKLENNEQQGNLKKT